MDWTKLILSLLLCQGAGAIGGFFTARKIPTWYAGLVKPSFNPPGWVFGPVWTFLYILMGVALYWIWARVPSNPARTQALMLFGGQLILNALWSYLFFGLQKPRWALVEMGALWLLILATLLAFRALIPPTIWLLLPYLAWVTFAFFLNWSIARLNP